MVKKADIGSKRLISLSPNQWVKWVTNIQEAESREILSSEFQWISRDSDVLIKAFSPEIGEFLVINELQLRSSSRMAKRMFAYTALATEKYDLPVYPVLINILPPSAEPEIANQDSTQFQGLEFRCDYQVINLWEVDVAIVFQQSLSSLLPFVPVLKGGDDADIVREALGQLRQSETLNELEPLLAFFATFVLESKLVQEIMRWDMAILRESPWYQEILKEGEKRGIEKGIERGIERGIQQELLSSIEWGLELKFGSEGLTILGEIRQITDVEILRQIRQALLKVNNLEQLRPIYQNHL